VAAVVAAVWLTLEAAGGAYDLSGVVDAWTPTTDATHSYSRVSPWRAPLSLTAASIPSRRALI
jgi:hypothetical protein